MKNLLALLTTALSATAFAQGGSGVKGGDFLSQGFLARMRALPNVIRAKGAHHFPEIDLDRLTALVNDPALRVEKSEDPLLINGAPKDAWNWKELKLVQIHGKAIAAQLLMPGGDLRVDAIALHEAAGMLEIEGTNDYHISGRLLGDLNEGLLCSSSKFDLPAGSPGVLTIGTTYDFVRQYQNCTSSMTGGTQCSLSATPTRRMPGDTSLATSIPTSYYERRATSMILRQDTLLETFAITKIKEGWIFNGKISYEVRGTAGKGKLDIDWDKKVSNSAGEQLATASLTWPSIDSRSAQKSEVFCKWAGAL